MQFPRCYNNQNQPGMFTTIQQKELLTGSTPSDAVIDELDVPRLLEKLNQGS